MTDDGWTVGARFDAALNGYAITSRYGTLMAVATYRGGTEPAKRAAKQIVNAVNNHGALVEALRQLLDDKATTYAVRVNRARRVLDAVSTPQAGAHE